VKREFFRYGFPPSIRILTGILQLSGAVGLMIGSFIPLLGLMASVGLTLMMVVAFAVRIKIKDGPKETAPSLIFAFLNAYLIKLFYVAFKNTLL
jgi:uncharacterized membrane protein YphA (DoxX/SURF4 family)